MKTVFNITDRKLIIRMLDAAEYGTLALTDGVVPYAVPVNFVYFADCVYFHGSPRGKKMIILNRNPRVSFNVVSDAVFIPSYFSSNENLACPASAFFRSVTIDGVAKVVKANKAKREPLTALMQKLQSEGGYKALSDSDYEKNLNAVCLVKIEVETLSAKFKFGQNLNRKRFAMVQEHLKQRGSEFDLLTIKAMQDLR